jgi:hypothetical protein
VIARSARTEGLRVEGKERYFVRIGARPHALIEPGYERGISPMDATSHVQFERPRLERRPGNHRSPTAGRPHVRRSTPPAQKARQVHGGPNPFNLPFRPPRFRNHTLQPIHYKLNHAPNRCLRQVYECPISPARHSSPVTRRCPASGAARGWDSRWSVAIIANPPRRPTGYDWILLVSGYN